MINTLTLSPIRISKSIAFTILVGSLATFCQLSNVCGQGNFSSGSTGANGAFAPTSNQTVQVPASGVFNYTTVNIPAGVTIAFTPNATNSPVTILATGNVTIAGIIIVSGSPASGSGAGGLGGPGGFRGGNGGSNVDTFAGTIGDGRGGGLAGKSDNGATGTAGGGGGGGHAFLGADASAGSSGYLIGQGGPRYGTTSLIPLTGGSGGGGGGATTDIGGGGGGGGGTILIASSGTITLSGAVNAIGGAGAITPYRSGGGGGGAGGAVRLIANTILGAGSIDVRGGNGGYPNYGGSTGGKGGNGYIRIEAYNYSSFTPNLNQVPVSITLPNSVSPPSNIQLKIASVAGTAAPANAAGSLQGPPDIILPGTLANPVTVGLQAANIPLGTTVQITLTPISGTRITANSTPLSGTLTASTATASITLPRGTSVITAALTMDLVASNQPLFIDGEQVKRIEVAAVYGGETQTTYITASGQRLTGTR